jgi:hypothetical protein
VNRNGDATVVRIVIGSRRAYPYEVIFQVVTRLLVVETILEDSLRAILILDRDCFIRPNASNLFERQALDHSLNPIVHFSLSVASVKAPSSFQLLSVCYGIGNANRHLADCTALLNEMSSCPFSLMIRSDVC